MRFSCLGEGRVKRTEAGRKGRRAGLGSILEGFEAFGGL